MIYTDGLLYRWKSAAEGIVNHDTTFNELLLNISIVLSEEYYEPSRVITAVIKHEFIWVVNTWSSIF